MPDIFISYSREDQPTARRFADAFRKLGFDVWWDVTLHSGEAYDEVTETALRGARAVVVLWSPRSVASRWVRAEATLADRSKTLAPAMIAPCERPIMFELTQTADLGHWQGEETDRAWLSFVADVRRLVEGRGQTVGEPRSSSTPDAKPAAAWLTPALVEGLTQLLVPAIGPVARLVVEDEARAASTVADLIRRLGGRIPDTASRNAFLAAAGSRFH